MRQNLLQLECFISVEVNKILRKSWAQFGEKLRKLRLRQNDGSFYIKKRFRRVLVSALIFMLRKRNGSFNLTSSYSEDLERQGKD